MRRPRLYGGVRNVTGSITTTQEPINTSMWPPFCVAVNEDERDSCTVCVLSLLLVNRMTPSINQSGFAGTAHRTSDLDFGIGKRFFVLFSLQTTGQLSNGHRQQLHLIGGLVWQDQFA